jgi:integrase
MGVYRRKGKNGKPYGPWIIQYPRALDPATGKIRYTSEKAGQSKRLADRAFANKMVEWEKKKHLGLEAKKDFKFVELVHWYLGLPVAKKKKSYVKDVERSKHLVEYFGQKLAREIRPVMIESFQQEMLDRPCCKGTGYRPATVNRMHALMKRIYSLAVREDLVEKNPCLKVPMLPENNKRDRVISHGEYQALLSHLPEYAADVVVTAYYTGMRLGEILGLTWKRVDPKEGFIELEEEDTKTSEPRRIYYNGVLKDIFLARNKVRRIDHGFVFTYRGKHIQRIYKSFKKACENAGIENFTFHDLRHTFNTNMRKAGVDRSVIMKITGHKTTSMFERYNTVDKGEAREAMQRLDEHLNTNSGGEITSLLLQGGTGKKKGGRLSKLTPLKN